MAKYSAKMQRTASSSASVGIVNAPASGMRRAKIYDLVFGSEGTPADVANLWQLQRATAAGTTTAVTPQALDPADAAAVTVAGENATVEPTYTSNAFLLTVALNQKATFRWIAAPGGELLIPATASNGIGIKTPTAGSSVAISAAVHFEEQ
jgi:hypothetical protein